MLVSRAESGSAITLLDAATDDALLWNEHDWVPVAIEVTGLNCRAMVNVAGELLSRQGPTSC